ncbi:MAG TPA: AMP-binding protein, partial [Nannocystis sp.]
FPCLAAPDDTPLLTVDGVTLTRRALALACARHVAWLRAAGVQQGDHVGVWTQPDLATPVALAANALFGAVSVPINPRLGTREAAHIAADARPRLCLAADPSQIKDSPLGPAASLAHLSDPTCAISPVPERRADATPLLILYTSGTTGLPKGAVLGAAGVAANLDALARVWRWGPEHAVVHALPLFHVHGLVLGWFGSLRVGGRMVWLPRFDPTALAAALTADCMLFAVPTMYHRLAEVAEADPAVASGLAAARLLVSGSAALGLREQRRITGLCGHGVHERYGLTETLINCAVPADGPPQPGRVGPPLPGVELRLVDDERRPLATSDDTTIGEIAVRGPQLFLGYLNHPVATDPDGWFHTGDLATRDAEGSLRIVGRRATDLIKSGGFKIGAGEIEACLAEHPEISEVAVIGVDDPDLGERIVAFVVPRDLAAPPPAEALIEFVAAALAPHKRPRRVVFLEALPRNAMGKVLKPALRTHHL